MAITCAKCGRQYDVTLFQFGRTINCACGARVGLEHKINLPAATAEIKFFADVNVARLVRWLRAIGVDTVWEDAISDSILVRRAIEENRFILTLDKKLVEEWRVDNVLVLKSEDPQEQLKETVRRFRLAKPETLFTRCLVCNEPLRLPSDEEISAGKISVSAPSAGRFTGKARTREECAPRSKKFFQSPADGATDGRKIISGR
jgi:uncharacterized protein with PIN domain